MLVFIDFGLRQGYNQGEKLMDKRQNLRESSIS